MSIDKYINQIIEGNCVGVMRKFEDEVIDLIVTSLSHDDLRNYKGFVFPFEDIARELYRTKK
jgi:site-specific DNA-methyltransferase (adenine-specific)